MAINYRDLDLIRDYMEEECMVSTVDDNDIFMKGDVKRLKRLHEIVQDSIDETEKLEQTEFIKENYGDYGEIMVKNKDIIDGLRCIKFVFRRDEHNINLLKIIEIDDMVLEFAIRMDNIETDYESIGYSVTFRDNRVVPLIDISRTDETWLMREDSIMKEIADKIGLEYDSTEDIFNFLNGLGRCHRLDYSFGSWIDKFEEFNSFEKFTADSAIKLTESDTNTYYGFCEDHFY